MTTADPDRLRREIEYTQRNLSSDVDLLAEKVTPGRIVQRRVDRARGAMSSVRDRVMGTASDGMSAASNRASSLGDRASSLTDRASDQASSVADKAQSLASDAAQKAGEVPGAVRRGTEGNPLAAGLIAFGAGWLLSTLAPATKKEQQVAGQATDWAREHSQVVTEQVGQIAQDVKENLREPAQDAVQSVRSTATDAAGTVRDEAKGAAGTVADRAQEAKSSVQENRS